MRCSGFVVDGVRPCTAHPAGGAAHALSYHPVLYAPLALLHASLAVRVLVSTPIGAWGNAGAIVLFFVVAASLVLRRALSRAGRPAGGA